MIQVSIVILNFNGKDYIVDCLDTVKELLTNNIKLEIIVVDNASTDGSDILIKQKYPQFLLLRSKVNLGYTGGNNLGVKYAVKNGADYVLLLNPDTLVEKNLVVSSVKVAESDKKIGVLGPKIYFASGKEYYRDRYLERDRGKVIWYAGGIIDWKNLILSHRGVDEVDDGQYDKQVETDFISGCCLLIKREVLEKIGMLDDKYFLYLEDTDFCQRTKLAGYKVIYTPEAALWHINAGSSSVGGILQDYYITRNRLLFGMNYAGLRTKIALLREGFKLLLKGRMWQRTGVKDFFLGRFGKGSWNN